MDDVISREQAIYAVSEALATGGQPIKALEQLPPIQPKRGKWMYNGNRATFKIYTCDKCGWNSEAEFNFCPSCGADMREVTT